MSHRAPGHPRRVAAILFAAIWLPLLAAGCVWLAPTAVPEPQPPATLRPLPPATPSPPATPTRRAPTPTPTAPPAEATPSVNPTSAAAQERTPPPTADPLAALEDGVTLTFWHPLDPEGAAGKALDALLAEFEQIHPEVRVEATAYGSESLLHREILLGVAEGRWPDLALAAPSAVADYVRRGVVEPLDPYLRDPSLAPSPAAWGDLFDGVRQGGRFPPEGGGRYLWPYAQHAVGLWYNLDLLRAAGYTRPPATWEEFEAMSRAVAEHTEAEGYGYVPTGRLAAAWLVSGGEALLTGDWRRAALAEAGGTEALALVARLAAGGAARPYTTAAEALADFAQGRVALLSGSTGDLQELRRAIGAAGNGIDAWGQVPLPRRAGSEAATALSYGDGLCILRSDETRQLAGWLLIRFLTDPRQAAQWARMGYLPLSASAGGLLADHFARSPVARQQFLEIAPYTLPEPGMQAWPEVEDYLLEALLASTSGVAGPEEALAKAAALADQALSH